MKRKYQEKSVEAYVGGASIVAELPVLLVLARGVIGVSSPGWQRSKRGQAVRPHNTLTVVHYIQHFTLCRALYTL